MSTLKVNDIQTIGGLPNRGKVLQVQTTFSNTILSGSTDYDIISLSITPSFTTSKILLMYNGNIAQETASGLEWALYAYRGATQINAGSTYGTSGTATFQAFGTDNVASATNANGSYTITGILVDSPTTTSATTYKIRVVHITGSVVVVVGKSGWTGSSNEQVTNGYSLTLMEIAA
jgi:hypothetical protein